MKCITSFLVLSIAVIINGCSMMKSNIETQFSNIKLISGFPQGRPGMTQESRPATLASLAITLLSQAAVIFRSLVRKSTIQVSMPQR